MSRVIQAAEFFVVGGPVQPDRPCYIERPADHLLEIALQSQRCCCVLGPRATGKSSLMGRVARTLRQRGELVAVVDLAQIGARGESLDADRWAYSIANKIAHELRLTVDLRGWWDEQNALLSEHRLTEFLWDLVLTNTAVPVTVFVDEIEQALGLPFAAELFTAIEACYSRRQAEPDYARLNFVLLGVASPGALGADSPSSPFAEAAQIELPDFSPEQAYRLSIGFGGEPAHAQALMDRVLAWTGGHPYLTQKVARGVARKNGRLEDVEHVVRDQLLAAAASRDEPLLNHIRSQLTARDPSTRAALKLLGAVARGAHVAASGRPAAVEVLRLSGVVSVDADRRLVYRNRVFKEAFGRRWVRSARPTRWLAWSAAAVLVGAAALAGYYWYAQFLPQPYQRVLADPAATQRAATAAYEHLRVLPGFAEEAERLFAAALERRAAAAETFDELMAADTALRALPEGAAAADGLRAQFWLRRAKAAAVAERRSAALLLAQRAATQPQTPAGAAGRAMLAELLGDDYPRLARTVSVEPRPTDWSVDWSRTRLILLGAEHDVSLASLGEPTGGADDVSVAPVELTALQHTPLVRELAVDDGGSAGAFTLEITLMHPAVNELLITLAAPSGVQANVALPRNSDDPTYRFVADGRSPLAALADEDRSGVWRLTIVDRRVDQAGELASWRLTFGEQSWADEPEAPVPIPDASRTSQVTVNVDGSGTFAIVQPSAPSVIGAVSLWNLAEARLANDFTLPAPARYVALNAPARRLAVVSADSLSLWNVVDGLPVARLATQTQFVLPPVFSAEGHYLAIAESVEAAAPLVSILRSEDGTLVTSVAGLDGVRGWWLGPDAGYLAMRTSAHVVRIIDPRRGSELAVLRHGRDVERVVPLPSGAVVVTIDAAGAIRAWDLSTARAGAVTPRLLGRARDPAEVSVAADGSRLAYTSADGSVAVLAVPSGATVSNLRLPSATPPTQPRLAPDGGVLATESGTEFRRWQLPSGAATPAPVTDLNSANVTALAVGRDSDRVVAGFAAGQLRVLANPDDAERTSAPALSFFGHGGPVESIALSVEHDVVATGGGDGAVRLWDLASAAPVGLPMRRAGVSRQVPVTAVALSDDGAWVAGAAGPAVRVWQVKDAVLSAEIDMEGAATAVDFAPDGRRLAIGDDTGALRVAALGGAAGEARTSLKAAIRSLAFTADGTLIVAGDVDGRVQLVRAAGAAPIGAPVSLPAPIRWVGVSPDGSTVFAATDFWLHRLAVRPSGLEPLDARLPELRPAGAAFAALDDSRIRLAGFDGKGRLGAGVVDFSATAGTPAAAGAADRDFTVALGVRLDAAGRIVAAP